MPGLVLGSLDATADGLGDRLSVTLAFDNALAHRLYAAGDFFLMPSRSEPCGLGQLYAMAYGTPVVTSTGTSTEEVAAGAAVLVDPGDVASIATGIEEAFGRADQLAELGLARAAELSWDHTVDATVEAYREVAGVRTAR